MRDEFTDSFAGNELEPPGSAVVVRIELDQSTELCRYAWDTLSADEQRRAARLKIPIVRRRFVVCRARLRAILATVLNQHPSELRFRYGLHGKPELQPFQPNQETPVHFSVSHSANTALVALCRDHPVGVDVEEVRSLERWLRLAERFFSPQEFAFLAAMPADEGFAAFFEQWTHKEAYIKAMGRGMSVALDRFSFLRVGDVMQLVESNDFPSDVATWRFRSLALGGSYRGALAMGAGTAEVLCRVDSSNQARQDGCGR